MQGIRAYLLETYGQEPVDELIVYKFERKEKTMILFTAHWKVHQRPNGMNIFGREVNGMWESFNSDMVIEGIITEFDKLIFKGGHPDHPLFDLFVLTNDKKWIPVQLDTGLSI